MMRPPSWKRRARDWALSDVLLSHAGEISVDAVCEHDAEAQVYHLACTCQLYGSAVSASGGDFEVRLELAARVDAQGELPETGPLPPVRARVMLAGQLELARQLVAAVDGCRVLAVAEGGN